MHEHLDYCVSLMTTRPYCGGRWWFLCPLVRGGRQCRARIGRLYLPPGRRYFGCRRCYDLTYESCQESHQFDALYAGLAADIPGVTPADVKRVLSEW